MKQFFWTLTFSFGLVLLNTYAFPTDCLSYKRFCVKLKTTAKVTTILFHMTNERNKNNFLATSLESSSPLESL